LEGPSDIQLQLNAFGTFLWNFSEQEDLQGIVYQNPKIQFVSKLFKTILNKKCFQPATVLWRQMVTFAAIIN